MTLTSFSFFIFLAVVILTYYLCPFRFRHILLLTASICFFVFACEKVYTLVYLAISIFSVYFAALYFAKNNSGGKSKPLLIFTILLNIGILAVLKYTNFFISNINHIVSIFNSDFTINPVNFAASLGISFYTLTLISYLLDVYWQKTAPQKNLIKFALFGCYFPHMFSGPICRYDEVSASLYEKHPFDYMNLTHGLQRLFFGLLKKLVIAERLALIVGNVYDNPANAFGPRIILSTFAFALQLYADFSGCMDIVLGASECLGIRLPENFRSPFFSKTIQEFWQRWHITLGAFLKDYIMYPILKSNAFVRLLDFCKKKFGKKRGKRIPTYLGMLILWFAMGLWHGNSWKYIIGEGFVFWLFIVCGQLLKPLFDRLKKALHIKDTNVFFRIFQSLRTFLLFSVGMLFFRADSLSGAFSLIKNTFCGRGFSLVSEGSFMGLEFRELIVLAAGLVLMLVISLLNNKKPVRERIGGLALPIRWIIWYVLLLVVLIFGFYGSGYDSASFIYSRF